MDHTHARTKRSNSRGGEADKGGDAEGTYLYQSRRDVAAAGDQRGRDRTFRLRPPRAREILHARAREHLRRPIDRTDPAAGDRPGGEGERARERCRAWWGKSLWRKEARRGGGEGTTKRERKRRKTRWRGESFISTGHGGNRGGWLPFRALDLDSSGAVS